jgi:mono/diheme cytochrome c family protein
MRTRKMKAALIVLAAVLSLAAGAAAFVASGFYNIGADDHHTKLTLAIIDQLRERSIEVRALSISPLLVADPDRVKLGAERYDALCVGCHLAPGLTKSDIRAGLYPHPPNLAQEDLKDSRRAFWIIKHGIKMTGMPAWGKTLDDPAIWELVTFVKKMPDMTAETYRQMSQRP